MTVNQGPQPPAPPRYEATRQYKHQLREFEKLITLGGIEAGSIPLIIGGMHLIDIDLVSILQAALAAEIDDPEPQCGTSGIRSPRSASTAGKRCTGPLPMDPRAA